MSWQPFTHPSHAYAAGRALAELHRASAGHDAQVRTVLDFGLSDRTCAVMDLALAIERNAIDWLVQRRRAKQGRA